MVLRAHDAIKAQSGKSCCRLGFGQRSRVWKKFTCGSFEMASKMSREHFSIREFLFRATVMWPGAVPRVRVCAPALRPCFLLKPSNPRGEQLRDRRTPSELDNSRGDLRSSERSARSPNGPRASQTNREMYHRGANQRWPTDRTSEQ